MVRAEAWLCKTMGNLRIMKTSTPLDVVENMLAAGGLLKVVMVGGIGTEYDGKWLVTVCGATTCPQNVCF